MMKAKWSVADAKAHFAEVVEKAKHQGPQIITKNGKEAVVVVSAEEWRRREEASPAVSRPRGTLLEFFLNSPLRGSGIDLERIKDKPRDIDL